MSVRLRTAASIRSSTAKRWRTASPHAGSNTHSWARELGGRPDDASCYENGRVRYDLVNKTRLFQRGIERIVRDMAKRRIALMCSEKEPLECHRTLLVAQALQAQGVAVEHILADGEPETHAAAMDRLLALHDDPRQEDLFGPRDERIARAIAKQTERIAYKNKTPSAS